MDTAGLKYQVLTLPSSPQCRGKARLLIPCQNIYLPGFEQGFENKNVPAVLGINLGCAKRKVNILGPIGAMVTNEGAMVTNV